MYLPIVVAFLCAERYVFGAYFQVASACYGHSSSELIILNHHFSSLHGIELILFMC